MILPQPKYTRTYRAREWASEGVTIGVNWGRHWGGVLIMQDNSPLLSYLYIAVRKFMSNNWAQGVYFSPCHIWQAISFNMQFIVIFGWKKKLVDFVLSFAFSLLPVLFTSLHCSTVNCITLRSSTHINNNNNNKMFQYTLDAGLATTSTGCRWNLMNRNSQSEWELWSGACERQKMLSCTVQFFFVHFQRFLQFHFEHFVHAIECHTILQHTN